MRLKLIAFGILASCSLLFGQSNSFAAATCKQGDCACWIKAGGYCTNYIKIKTGKSQSGDANKWKSNIKSSDIKKGDVAIFKSKTHVAYIEAVNKDKNGKPTSIKVSEYNYGSKWVDKSCIVTDKFGIVSTRSPIDIGSVDGGFWRP